MQRIVWGRASSSNVMKVLWGLGELGLPFERIDVGGQFGKTDTPEYRAMNPTGLVPTLQEGDFTLWESNAILRYLCHAHTPGSALWPQDPRARANIDRWMDAQQTSFNRPMSAVFWGLVRTPADQRDLAAIQQAIHDTTVALDAALARHGTTLADQMAWRSQCAHGWWDLVAPSPPDLPNRPDRPGVPTHQPGTPFWQVGCAPHCAP